MLTNEISISENIKYITDLNNKLHKRKSLIEMIYFLFLYEYPFVYVVSSILWTIIINIPENY